jgi:hypothetical protein
MTMMRLVFAFLTAAGSIGAAPGPGQTIGPCDRACLSRLAGRYMDALVTRAPAGLPWAETVRYTENSVPMMIGDGLWGSISGHGTGLIVADAATGNVAWLGRVDDHGQPAFYAMRLKIVGRRIAEVEAVARRKEGRPPFGDPATFVYSSSYGDRLPAAARSPRDRIRGLIEGYYNSMARNDGTVLTRFDPACRRTENGVDVSDGGAGQPGPVRGCEAQFALGLFRAVDRVRDRRIPIIDDERGIALAIGYADYSAREQRLMTTDGRPFAPPTTYPHTLGFMALVQVKANAITRIDETANEQPYRMPSPWRG